MGVPAIWVTDTATHSENKILSTFGKVLCVDQCLATAYLPFSNCACKHMMREIVPALKAMLNEEMCNSRDWVGLRPAIQWALILAVRECYVLALHHLIW